MTSGPGVFAAEIVQSRNASAAETLAILRTRAKTFKSRVAAVEGGRFNRAVLLLAAGVVGAIFIATVESRWVRGLPTIYALSAIVLVGAVAMRIWMRSYSKRCADVYRESFKANRRLVMDQDALVAANAAGVSTSIPWSAIEDIVDDQHAITIYLSAAELISLPKAACENQDTEHFCQELRRRWLDRRPQRAWRS